MRVKNGYIDEGVPMSHPHQSLPSHCSISELSFFLSVVYSDYLFIIFTIIYLSPHVLLGMV
ncbi:unnamed protein product [Brassica oleracea var. botrytis]|uniref:Uncharacterized protein n=2 Tax=Brassica TaxID=3705 RepID=A0A3P6EA46_BRAOL|nr:unnamed protein product [Brassica napus]CDY59383.1 BnaC09g52660D [Brassica napus]VDD31005.1 unnamed protein product [Brassica oleracea]